LLTHYRGYNLNFFAPEIKLSEDALRRLSTGFVSL
jgi:hypothetical protein